MYQSHTIRELRDMLAAKGLARSGRKAELVERLVLAGARQASSSSPGKYSRMTVAQLKDELRSRGLKVSGLKAVLVQRLEEAFGAGDVGASSNGTSNGATVGAVNGVNAEEAALPRPASLQPMGGDEASGRPPVDLRGFEGVSSDLWLDGVIRCVMSFGAFVEVAPPGAGPKQWGLLCGWELPEAMLAPEPRPRPHQTNSLPDGCLEVGQHIRVRIVRLDQDRLKLGLSARELDDNIYYPEEAEEESETADDEGEGDS